MILFFKYKLIILLPYPVHVGGGINLTVFGNNRAQDYVAWIACAAGGQASVLIKALDSCIALKRLEHLHSSLNVSLI